MASCTPSRPQRRCRLRFRLSARSRQGRRARSRARSSSSSSSSSANASASATAGPRCTGALRRDRCVEAAPHRTAAARSRASPPSLSLPLALPCPRSANGDPTHTFSHLLFFSSYSFLLRYSLSNTRPPTTHAPTSQSQRPVHRDEGTRSGGILARRGHELRRVPWAPRARHEARRQQSLGAGPFFSILSLLSCPFLCSSLLLSSFFSLKSSHGEGGAPLVRWARARREPPQRVACATVGVGRACA